MAEASGELGLRERTRRAVRAELVSVAMDLFARKGYDATTIDEIAAAAGMSRSTFFRYFTSKEDVVLGHLSTLGRLLVDALAKRPADEDAWTALRRAFDILLAYHAGDPQGTLGLRLMIDSSPELRARNLEKQCRWHDPLIPHIADRLGPTSTEAGIDARPEAIIGAALACLEAANRAWRATDGQAPLDKVLDDVMRTVRPGAF